MHLTIKITNMKKSHFIYSPLSLTLLIFLTLCTEALYGQEDACVNSVTVEDLDQTRGPADITLSETSSYSMTISGDLRIISANNIPDHTVGDFPNAEVSAQSKTYEIDLTPSISSSLTPLLGENGPQSRFGILFNGVELDPIAAEPWPHEGLQSPDANWEWNYEALNIFIALDINNAHVQPTGEYHYHGAPTTFLTDFVIDQTTMTQIGYAADGFPIYYKYAYTDAEDAESGVVAMTPSYQLRSGERLGDGDSAPCGEYNGVYSADYEYEEDLGTLDRANGRYGVTPEYPGGTYYYIVTDEYPQVPRYLRGVASDDFGFNGGTAIPEDVNVITWDGSESTLWENMDNWDAGALPTQYDSVIILNGNNLVIDRGVEASVYDLTLDDASTLTIESGGSLFILNDFTETSSVIAKRNPEGDGGYSLIGSPIASQSIASLNADYVYTYDGDLGVFEVPTGDMVPGEGYFVAYDEANPVISLDGIPNTGDISVTVEADEYKLLSNPYLAPISFTYFINNAANTDGNIWIWDDGGSNTGSDRSGGYVTVNSAGVSAGFGGSTANAFSGSIASFQGFFVKGSSTGGDVTFTPTMQSHSNGNADNSHFRTTGISSHQLVRISLSGNAFYNEAVVGFSEKATMAKDWGLDAEKFRDEEAFAFYSMQEEKEYAIQFVPLVEGNVSIPLGFNIAESGTYQFAVEEQENINYQLSVFDGSTGNTHDLSANEPMSFYADKGMDNLRFSLILNNEVLGAVEAESDIAIYGNTHSLIIKNNQKTTEEVVIYTMDGRLHYNETVDFANSLVSLHVHLNPNQLYIVQVGNVKKKFIANY